MAHIYFTRHGQTVWNVENKICGMTDIELTKLGHRQAEELGILSTAIRNLRHLSERRQREGSISQRMQVYLLHENDSKTGYYKHIFCEKC